MLRILSKHLVATVKPPNVFLSPKKVATPIIPIFRDQMCKITFLLCLKSAKETSRGLGNEIREENKNAKSLQDPFISFKKEPVWQFLYIQAFGYQSRSKFGSP